MNADTRPRLTLRSILTGWILGIAITLIEMVLFPLRLLRLPVEFLAGFHFEPASDGIIVTTPSGIFDSGAIVVYFISLLGLAALAALLVIWLGRLGVPRRRAAAATGLALLFSFYLVLPVFDALFTRFAGFEWFSDLRFSPGIVFHLHFAFLTFLFSQPRLLSRNWLFPLSAYLLTLGAAMVIQQVIGGTGSGPLWRQLLASPLAWLNSMVFVVLWDERSTHFLKPLVIALGVNLVTVLLAFVLG